MITAEILEVLTEKQHYRVRVYNNKPLRDKRLEETEEAYLNAHSVYLDAKQELINLDTENKIKTLQDKIDLLTAEKNPAKNGNEILSLYTQIRDLRQNEYEVKTKIRIAEQHNHEAQQAHIKYQFTDPFYDYTAYSSAYKDFKVGDVVPVIFNGYNLDEVVIAPPWNWEEGFGSAVTSIELMSTNEFHYSDIMAHYLVGNGEKYIKAKIMFSNEDSTSFQVVNLATNEYIDCTWQYYPTSENPYSINDYVLVKLGENRQTGTIIGFWQAPRRPYKLKEGIHHYKDGVIVSNMWGESDYAKEKRSYEDLLLNRNWMQDGSVSQIKTPDGDILFQGFGGQHNKNFVYSPTVQHNDDYCPMWWLSAKNRAGQVIPTSDNDARTQIGGFFTYTLDTPMDVAGKTIKYYFYPDRNSGSKKMTFHPIFKVFKNYIVDYDHYSKQFTVANGIIVKPQPDRKVAIRTGGGATEIIDFDSQQAQDFLQDIIDQYQGSIDYRLANGLGETYLYTHENGQHHSTFASYINFIIENRIFNVNEEWDFRLQKVHAKNLLKVFDRNKTFYDTDLLDTRYFPDAGNTSYSSHSVEEAQEIISKSVYSPYEDTLNKFIHTPNLLPNQDKEWYVVNDVSDFEGSWNPSNLNETVDWYGYLDFGDMYSKNFITEFDYQEIIYLA